VATPVLLLIADIGGYTRFMSYTRTNLAHSQQIVAGLLEALIDAAEGTFEVAKLEGDAAFFYRELKRDLPSAEEAEAVLARMRYAFKRKLEDKQLNNVCSCEGCTNVDQLTLKFVVHTGEVAFQKVKHFVELAGVDVIIVHRMLKNDVPIKEYVLMTEPLVPTAPPSLKPGLNELEHNFEGIGATKTWYADLIALPKDPAPPVKKNNYLVRWIRHLAFMWKTLPVQLGWRKPVKDVRPPLPSGATST
jgi:hypothetical protein